MKITKIAQLMIVAAALACVWPAQADTVSVPSAEKSAFTVDVPSGWKPKADKSDESVDATSADGHAYMTAWLVKSSAPNAEEQFVKDLGATLKDSLKSVEQVEKEQPFEVNGATGVVVNGTGTDKRAGTKVKFRVVLVPAGKE